MLYERIVAIDDDVRQLESLKLILGKQYEVICFQDGKQAVDYLRRPNSIRLVLTDVCMQGMDGLCVLKEIKEISRDVAVMIMTGYGSKEVVVEALQNGADDFIDKPFDVPALKEKIKALLRKKCGAWTDKGLVPERTRFFVEKNLADVTIKDIAEDLYLSEKYVGRVFKEQHDVSFREYKSGIKIEKAKDWLKNTSYSVYKISEKLGYQNPETFMRMFKRKTSLTPSQYRLSVRDDVK